MEQSWFKRCVSYASRVYDRQNKSEDECETEQDKLLYLLKNSAQMTVPPKWGEEEADNKLLHN